MSATTSIEWTDASWNPILGCTKISQGCKHCYAEALMERFAGVPGHPFEEGFSLRLVPSKLEEPLRWARARKIFTCSMSDLFHEDIPLAYIRKIFDVMETANWHTYQVLTKRSKRLLELSNVLPWPEHIWMGVSIESAHHTDRALDLAAVPAAVRFLSVEPLLGSIPHLPLKAIDWVIVGGESGPKARPMELEWARDIRRQCQEQGVAFFLKQLGGRRGKRGGEQAVLDGRLWHQFPQTSSAMAT